MSHPKNIISLPSSFISLSFVVLFFRASYKPYRLHDIISKQLSQNWIHVSQSSSYSALRSFPQSSYLAMNLLGPYVQKCRKILHFFSRPALYFFLIFYRARSLNEKYKKLCTFSCVLTYELSTNNELPPSIYFNCLFYCRILL